MKIHYKELFAALEDVGGDILDQTFAITGKPCFIRFNKFFLIMIVDASELHVVAYKLYSPSNRRIDGEEGVIAARDFVRWCRSSGANTQATNQDQDTQKRIIELAKELLEKFNTKNNTAGYNS